MKKLFTILALFATLVASAQNTQTAAAEAAAALSTADDVPEKVEKPKYWTNFSIARFEDGDLLT